MRPPRIPRVNKEQFNKTNQNFYTKLITNSIKEKP